jgi:hypothetical protein
LKSGGRFEGVRQREASSGRAIKQYGRSIKRTPTRPKSSKASAGHAIKKCERAIIPISAKARQQDAHDHVADVKKGEVS